MKPNPPVNLPEPRRDSSRILVIDDLRAIHDDFRKILSAPQISTLELDEAQLFGLNPTDAPQVIFEVDSAYQGEEGLKLVRDAAETGSCYSLAFVDVRMPPGWDGVETAAQLWAVDPDLQIVICTAYSDHSWNTIAKRLGNRDSLVILKKPFDPVEILQLAHALTKKWVLTKQSRVRCSELEAKVAERTGELATANDQLLLEVNESRRTGEQMKVQISALTAAANAIVITDPQGKIEWANPAFTKLTGYGMVEALGKSLSLLKSNQHPPSFYANLWTTISTGNVWHGEITNKRKDGGLYTEDLTITPVHGADGQIVNFVAIKQDITEERQIQSKLQQAQKMEAIGTLAGGIAHDFNNILSAIFGYGSLLQQDTLGNSAAQQDIEEILKAASRAKDLVQQILTVSRQREQKREVIGLDVVVREAVKFLRASLPANIKIEVNLAQDTPAVLADPTQIYQIIMNLGTNALHAMENRSGHLTVSLEPFLPDEGFLKLHPELKSVTYAKLIVADTGNGMSAKTLERIFEPFFTTKPVGKGTGLGLSVVHGLVQAHHAVIKVESQLGSGTTFSLYFPGKPAPADPAQDAIKRPPNGSRQTILVVDDEAALTATFQRILSRHNYQVVMCDNAPTALQLIQENPAAYDLVITDLTMPEMNGLDLARQIRAICPNLPVILASGYTSELSSENLKDAGVNELLQKPVSLPELVEMVHRVISAKA
jgi:PAS domain S-box-containing protein